MYVVCILYNGEQHNNYLDFQHFSLRIIMEELLYLHFWLLVVSVLPENICLSLPLYCNIHNKTKQKKTFEWNISRASNI